MYVFSGQTGSGKTYTMQGGEGQGGEGQDSRSAFASEGRGLIPRTFDYLFSLIASRHDCEYSCKCSFVEIYNEVIYDLLDPHGRVCSLREDLKRGVFVEDCLLVEIKSPAEALAVFQRGATNRHVAETSLNRESSRSHSVFTLFIQSRRAEGEIVDVTESRFNLVDLAGSERQQMAGTTGARLKEAGNINKSLLALSNVINALVELANGRPRHVHYRDSKLSFLLRDSLGGNAKTSIIANVTPSASCLAETLSTLRFAQRAKLIRNKAVVNKDIQGSLFQLQAEIRRLQAELAVCSRTDDVSLRTDDVSLRTDNIPLRPINEKPDNGNDNDTDILRMALERQVQLQDQVSQLQKQLELANELVRRKEQQVHSERLIVKFRDSTIKALQKNDHSEETAILRQEIGELRRQLEHHPEATRLAYENILLRERVAKADAPLAAQLAASQMYSDSLARRIVDYKRGLDDSTERLKLEAQLNDLQQTNDRLSCQITRLQTALGELEIDNVKRRKTENEHRDRLADLERAWNAERARLEKTLSAAEEQAKATINSLRLSLEAHQREYEKQRTRLETELERKCLQFEEAQVRLNLQKDEYERRLQSKDDFIQTGVADKEHAMLALSLATHDREKFQNQVKRLEEELQAARPPDESEKLLQQVKRLEFLLHNAQTDNEELLASMASLQGYQLLQRDNKRLMEELDDLRQEHDRLIQHQNIKQKLQYHVKIKQENNCLKEDLRTAREEIAKLHQRIGEIEEWATLARRIAEVELGDTTAARIFAQSPMRLGHR